MCRVLSNIRTIGLRISPAKTEAILFGYRSRQKPVLRLDEFVFKNDIKYLVLILDNILE